MKVYALFERVSEIHDSSMQYIWEIIVIDKLTLARTLVRVFDPIKVVLSRESMACTSIRILFEYIFSFKIIFNLTPDTLLQNLSLLCWLSAQLFCKYDWNTAASMAKYTVRSVDTLLHCLHCLCSPDEGVITKTNFSSNAYYKIQCMYKYYFNKHNRQRGF